MSNRAGIPFRNAWSIGRFALVLLLISVCSTANACLPEKYGMLQRHCAPESQLANLLQVVFGDEVPRQIAVLAGVSEYPNLSRYQQLPPADYDVETLASILIRDLKFDEVIVLKDALFTKHNLDYLFTVYLPAVLTRAPKSQVLFTFSGHGADFDSSGYLFLRDTTTIEPTDYADLEQAVNLSLLKETFKPTMRKAQHFLALINACHGGYFLNEGAFTFGAASLEARGAQGITAGGTDDPVHALPNVGSGRGSVFFEMVFAALQGSGVQISGKRFDDPAEEDGILSVTDLSAFLHDTIGMIENYEMRPHMGSLVPSRAGSEGEFFFITNRERAEATLRARFPQQWARVFGSNSEQAREMDALVALPSEIPTISTPQRAIYYFQGNEKSPGKVAQGTVTWAQVMRENGPAIQATLSHGQQAGTTVLTIYKNTDSTLPASHVVEVQFVGQLGTSPIERIPALVPKSTEQARGQALTGAAVPVTEELFWIALSDDPEQVERNLQLLREGAWFDIPILFRDGTRALLTFEKGAPGEKLFETVTATWSAG